MRREGEACMKTATADNPADNIGHSVTSGSPDRFGYEWNRYREILPEYEEQVLRWTAPLKKEDWKDQTFLDVGCGMGRNSFWPMTYGASGGVAVDVDERSVRSARETLKAFPMLKVEMRSAYELSFENQFDIAFSIGVVHHLEFPECALSGMVRATKPGGKVLIWVYGLENNEWIVRFFNPIRHALFSKLPIGFVHHLSIYPTILLWLFLQLGFGRIQYFDLIRRMKFSHLRSIVFDQMLPKIARYWSREDVSKLMTSAGLRNVQLVWVNGMSWTALGTKSEI